MENELLKKINNDNYRIINELIEVIKEEGISSLSDLKEYQDGYFQIDGKILNHSEQIDYCKKNIESNPYIPEDLDFVDIQKIDNLKNKLKYNSSEEEDAIILIQLFTLLGRNNPLPYDAYNLIMKE